MPPVAISRKKRRQQERYAVRDAKRAFHPRDGGRGAQTQRVETEGGDGGSGDDVTWT